MIEGNRMLNKRRSSTEVEESGFTLIELLIVIVVLGILAAIVVFALSGVTAKSTTAACQSDAKTVGVGVAALQAENPTAWSSLVAGPATTSGSWEQALLANSNNTANGGLPGGPFLQSWPTGNAASYLISIAVTGQAKTNDAPAVSPAVGDVIVSTPLNQKVATVDNTYDATVNPVSACTAPDPGVLTLQGSINNE